MDAAQAWLTRLIGMFNTVDAAITSWRASS